MLEEDALDAILAQAKDGNLLSFDGRGLHVHYSAQPEPGLTQKNTVHTPNTHLPTL
jgi:hypothetical protein